MNSGTCASSTRHTVWTRNAIFRLSRLSTASSPEKFSEYVYGVMLTLVAPSSHVRPGEVGPRCTP